MHTAVIFKDILRRNETQKGEEKFHTGKLIESRQVDLVTKTCLPDQLYSMICLITATSLSSLKSSEGFESLAIKPQVL